MHCNPVIDALSWRQLDHSLQVQPRFQWRLSFLVQLKPLSAWLKFLPRAKCFVLIEHLLEAQCHSGLESASLKNVNDSFQGKNFKQKKRKIQNDFWKIKWAMCWGFYSATLLIQIFSTKSKYCTYWASKKQMPATPDSSQCLSVHKLTCKPSGIIWLQKNKNKISGSSCSALNEIKIQYRYMAGTAKYFGLWATLNFWNDPRVWGGDGAIIIKVGRPVGQADQATGHTGMLPYHESNLNQITK